MQTLLKDMKVDIKLPWTHGIFAGTITDVLWDKVKVRLIAGPDRFNQEVEVNVSNIMGVGDTNGKIETKTNDREGSV